MENSTTKSRKIFKKYKVKKCQRNSINDKYTENRKCKQKLKVSEDMKKGNSVYIK